MEISVQHASKAILSTYLLDANFPAIPLVHNAHKTTQTSASAASSATISILQPAYLMCLALPREHA